jgi:thiamine biosynthesis protein ThiS
MEPNPLSWGGQEDERNCFGTHPRRPRFLFAEKQRLNFIMSKDGFIKIILNDLPEQVPADTSLEDLIRDLEEADPDLIVELNGRYVYSRDYATTIVGEGDRLEFINPNFGG